jgi:internalin A
MNKVNVLRRRRRSLFISYSHHDAKWLNRVQTMLSPLIKEDGIVVWDDSRITPGSNWRIEIKTAIDTARVALLLVSPNFLASKFIVDEELPPLLRAAQEDGLTILWVLISPCLYKKTAIAEFQAAHAISKPLAGLQSSRRDQELLQIAENVAGALQKALLPSIKRKINGRSSDRGDSSDRSDA